RGKTPSPRRRALSCPVPNCAAWRSGFWSAQQIVPASIRACLGPRERRFRRTRALARRGPLRLRSGGGECRALTRRQSWRGRAPVGQHGFGSTICERLPYLALLLVSRRAEI